MLLPVVALAFFLGTISADNPFIELRSNFELQERDTNLAEPNYRLLDTVQPTFLDVDLDVYLEENRFNGMVQIQVDVLEEGMTQIVLHQKVVSIDAVTVLNANNQLVALQFPDPFTTDDYFELLKINFADPITAGQYTLVITYTGKINENPLERGFYKGYYYLNDEKRYYATTQFQPYFARLAFPCFDEPQFKSRFVISITRDANLSPSYSNMAINTTQTVANGRVRETFLPTPIISAYLIAFHYSDFVETTATGTAAKPFGIISRQGPTDQHEYAADMGVAITAWLDEYLDYPYYEMGQGVPMKNDHIALPDFPSGAMENWGMVNYREAYLLYDPANTNVVNKIFIATILAHELGHKWFGNLVTCFWWSNLWLNESFASYFEYFAVDGVDQTLELEEQFIVDYVHAALASDASAGATPMNWTGVVTNPSITSHFSATSYSKGASVLRMMEHFVRPDTFRKALRYYLKDNEYALGTPEDMYAAFRTATAEDGTLSAFPGIDVGQVFDSWVQNPGAPVINVNVDSDVITVTQERFQLTGETPSTIWQIPLTYTRGSDINFEDTTPFMVMTEREVTFNKPSGAEWVIFNLAQSGLYRVNYNDDNWQAIAVALRESRDDIHKLNRAQIVNDIFYFLRTDRISFQRAFDVISFLNIETDYYVWVTAITHFEWLRRRLEHIPELHEEYVAYVLEALETGVYTIGYNEQASDLTTDILNRMQLVNYATNLGHEASIADSLAKWEAYKANDNNLVGVNYRRYVYCNGIRYGDQSDYDFLWNKYNTSENTADMVVMLRALACTTDSARLQHYLDQSLYNDRIRIHDRTNAFQYALLGNKENLQTVLDFLYNNYAEIRELYGGSARLTTCISALATYMSDFRDIVAFQTWLYANQLNLPGEFSTGVAVVNSAMANIEWGNNVSRDLQSAMRGSATTLILPFTLLLAALSAHLLR